MKTDVYTKFVLTVIASCLLWLCIAGTPAAVDAQVTPPGNVRITSGQPVSGQNVYLAGVVGADGKQTPFYVTGGQTGVIPVVVQPK